MTDDGLWVGPGEPKERKAIRKRGPSCSAPSGGSVSDLVRLDWMEDNPVLAIAVLEQERDAVLSGHMMRQRIDEAMLKPNTR